MVENNAERAFLTSSFGRNMPQNLRITGILGTNYRVDAQNRRVMRGYGVNYALKNLNSGVAAVNYLTS